MPETVKKGLWAGWIFGLPFGLWLVYHFFGSQLSGRYVEAFLLLLLSVAVSLFPIRVGNSDIFLAESVQIAVFLRYGLFVEVVLTQLSTFIFLTYLRVGKENAHRYPINSLMFFVVSVTSGFVYYLLGGTTGHAYAIPGLVPLVGYALTLFLTNLLLLFSIRRYLIKDHHAQLFGKDTAWQFVTTALVVPLGLVLYILLAQMGLTGIFYITIPLVSLAVVLRLYHSTQKMNRMLQKANSIGRELSEKLEVEDALDFFITSVGQIVPSDFGAIVFREGENHDIVRMIREGSDHSPAHTALLHKLSSYVCSAGRSLRYESRKQWQSFAEDSGAVRRLQSAVSVPMRQQQYVIGAVTLFSTKKEAMKNIKRPFLKC